MLLPILMLLPLMAVTPKANVFFARSRPIIHPHPHAPPCQTATSAPTSLTTCGPPDHVIVYENEVQRNASGCGSPIGAPRNPGNVRADCSYRLTASGTSTASLRGAVCIVAPPSDPGLTQAPAPCHQTIFYQGTNERFKGRGDPTYTVTSI